MQLIIEGNESPEQLRLLGRTVNQLADLFDPPFAVVPAADHVDNSGEPGDDDNQTGEPGGEEDQTATTTGGPVDHNGVPKNPDYVGDAEDPFYASGKRSGQWKKKRGVSDGDYDNWYAWELEQLKGAAPSEDDAGGNVNTAAAFGNGGQQQQTGPAVPRDTGEFMGWVSEQQAGGHLSQDRIQAAYQQAGIVVGDLFPPNEPDVVAQRIATLYGILTA